MSAGVKDDSSSFMEINDEIEVRPLINRALEAHRKQVESGEILEEEREVWYCSHCKKKFDEPVVTDIPVVSCMECYEEFLKNL